MIIPQPNLDNSLINQALIIIPYIKYETINLLKIIIHNSKPNSQCDFCIRLFPGNNTKKHLYINQTLTISNCSARYDQTHITCGIKVNPLVVVAHLK